MRASPSFTSQLCGGGRSGGAVLAAAPLLLLEWSPASIIVDDVLYPHAKQYMMVEKACLSQDHGGADLRMSSLDPCEHKPHRSRRA